MTKSFAAALLYDTALHSIKVYECADEYESDSVATLLRVYIKKHGYKPFFKVRRKRNLVMIIFIRDMVR